MNVILRKGILTNYKSITHNNNYHVKNKTIQLGNILESYNRQLIKYKRNQFWLFSVFKVSVIN